jgi:outer membrane protease
MRPYHKKVWTCAIIVTFILFFYTFSFAQTENIKGVQFKDGSIIYGRVIEMNVYFIHIETKDGKIISCKFDDVVNFIKDTGVDAKQEIKQAPVAEKILQTENIRGVRLKDGSVIYGIIVEMNVNKLIILTKDNEAITKKFDDVASFIKADDKEKSQVKKQIFNIAIGTEIMSGNTTYQIGYPFTAPNGTQYAGYFPFSKLEWPLDMWLVRIDAGLNIGDSWRINGVLKKNLSNPSDKMKDSDWITDSNPGRLDVYSESNISKFDALIFDIDVEWVFLKRQSWSLYAGLGYQYQKFEYDAKLIHQYSPSGLPGWEAYGDGRVGITYEITYAIPYLKIGTDFQISDKFTLAGSFAWSPIVKAKDEDHHLLRENGGKISTGDMDGNAYMIILSARYKFTPSWFLKGGFHYTKIDVDGEQYQIYGNGVPIGTVTQKSESTQTSLYLTVGYIF